jgi:hypothetical protein
MINPLSKYLDNSNCDNPANQYSGKSEASSPILIPEYFQHLTFNTGHDCNQVYSEFPSDERSSYFKHLSGIMLNKEPAIVERNGFKWPVDIYVDDSNMWVEIFNAVDRLKRRPPLIWFGVAVDASRGENLWSYLHFFNHVFGGENHLSNRAPDKPWIGAVLNYSYYNNLTNLEGLIMNDILMSWAGRYEAGMAMGFVEWIKINQSK